MKGARRIAPRRQAFSVAGVHGTPCRVPERQLSRRMQVERPAYRPRLDQRAIVPQRIAHVLLDDSVDAGVQGELGRGLDLRVDPARVARDLDDALRPCPFRHEAPGKSPRTNLVPGEALQLEEPLTVDELAAADEPEGALLENLHVGRCGVVLRVLLTVLRDPGPHRVIGLDPRHAVAVDEDRVAHQPPAAGPRTGGGVPHPPPPPASAPAPPEASAA